MKRSNRVLLVGLIVEIFLATLGAYLVMQIISGALLTPVSAAEAKTAITTVIGVAMGGFGGLLLVIYIVLKRRES